LKEFGSVTSDFVTDAPVPAPNDMEHEELFRLYGRWEPLTVRQVAELLDPIGIPWWIVGGHAMEAFTDVSRHHADIDVSIFRRDLGELRAALSSTFHLWSAGDNMLRPINDQFPEPHAGSDQVWVREHALAPWLVDMQLNPNVDAHFQSRREPEFVAPIEEVTWTRDGIRYLDPAVTLSFKAKGQRPKDHADFEAALPLMTAEQRSFLAGFLSRQLPGHPWLARLADG
jgi:hypothetical protein